MDPFHLGNLAVPQDLDHHCWSNPSQDSVGGAIAPHTELATISSKRGKVHTIDDLHPEILCTIFDFATTPSSPAKENFDEIVSLTHVSKFWRAILLNDSRIWSNIHIRGQPLDMAAIQIARCRQASLFIFVEVPSRRALRSLDPKTYIQQAARLIREHRDQVKRLEAHLDCRTFPQQFGCEWPNLTEIVWTDTRLVGSCPDGPIHTDPVNGGLPRLKNLFVKGGIDWPTNIATQLTTFKLEGPIDLDPSTFADFFRRNTSLVSLELNNINISGSSRGRQEEPIELPHLTKLTIHRTTCRHILRLLNPPSLKWLWVLSLEGRSPWWGCDWSEFCVRLMITTLKVRYCVLYKRVTVFGHSGLDTQSLRFAGFPPLTQCAAVLKALANVSLSSVTSISLIDNMPEGGVVLPTTTICALLGYLPRVTLMRLCPSDLALDAVQRLRDDLALCPELRELEAVVMGRTCRKVAEPIVEMVKARAGGGAERKMRRVECTLPAGSQRSEEVWVRRVWGRLREKAELEKYLSDE